ncbi:MAG: beta-hexosaminidase [Bacteroidetes bacterium]|nr:MAG: beta-hexosaminidase [Bacteroidota bacterium]
MKKLFALGICVFVFGGIKSQTNPTLNLLPVPAQVSIQNGNYELGADLKISVSGVNNDTILLGAINRIYQTLNRRTGLYFNTQYITGSTKPDSAAISIRIHNKAVANTNIDESYTLSISKTQISLEAENTQGALHGLQTILQLVYNENGKYYLPLITIKDSPRFKWRGLMIDVARHFIPIAAIERNIDAMAAVKLNVLHLHLADDEGFRIESKLFPQLTGKGSNNEFFTQSQIKEIVSYAKSRGIMVVPEFDMPGHTTSWFAGYPELAAAPGPYTPGPRFKGLTSVKNVGDAMKLVATYPTAAMDPSKESTYAFLDKFFGEMATLFPSGYVHIGCDENNGVAWMQNPTIVAFMKKYNMKDQHELQSYFANKVQKLLAKHGKHTIGWEEITKGGTVSKDVVVQVWQDASFLKKAISSGNRVLISKGFYLDLFMPASVHYNNELIPATIPDSISSNIVGGEAALWAEAVDQTNIDTRAWPRAAAIAERLWSPGIYTDADDMYRRLFVINKQLDESGLNHIISYERSVRRLAEGMDPEPVKTLTDVLTTVKGYRKMFGKMGKPEGYTFQTAPMIAVSDIIPVDSEKKRNFRNQVVKVLHQNDSTTVSALRDQLIAWRDNDAKLQNYFNQSQLLSLVKQHSTNLHDAAVIGLEALDKLKSSGDSFAAWQTASVNKLKEFKKPYAETELDIIGEIESLVKHDLVPELKTYPIF